MRFNPGSQIATLEVRTNTDNVLEMSESFIAMVTAPDTDRLTLCDPSNSSVTIEDGTTAEVFFSPPEYGVKEGETVGLMLQLTTDVAPGVSYEVTVVLVNGTAHSEHEHPHRGRVGRVCGVCMRVCTAGACHRSRGLRGWCASG